MATGAEQRRDEIIRNLRLNGKVRVSDLSRQYGISEVTVRNDLELLETQGILSRVRGGAVANTPTQGIPNPNERAHINVEAKKLLAEKVADLVDDNDTIMMNAGTTLTYVVHALRGKKNISIVTNSIQTANEITSQPGFNVVLLGGQVDPRYQFTFGNDGLRQLENYHAGKCILSFDGVNATYGLSLYYANEAPIVQRMAELSDLVIVAADHSKIGRNAFHKILPATDMDVLATNCSNRTEELDELRKMGVRVLEG